MEEVIKKFIDWFKDTDLKKQLAFLDVLNDLLAHTKKELKTFTSSESILISKAIKESDLLEIEQYKDDPEKLKVEITIFFNFIINIFECINDVALDRRMWIFSYLKPKDKFIDELHEQYWYIDDEIYKTISINRQSFISSLQVLWLIQKVDMKQFTEEVIKELNNRKLSKKEITLDNLFEELNWFFDFSWEDIQILNIENIKDEKVRKYLEIIISFYPYMDYLKEANNELKKIKLSFYYFDEKKLKDLDVKLSFDINLKNRKEYFKYEWWELNINWFKIHSPDKDSKLDNILDIIYKSAIKVNDLDFIPIQTIRKTLSENLDGYIFFNDKFLEDDYYSMYTEKLKKWFNKYDNDNLYNRKHDLVLKYTSTQQFDNSLKNLNKKIYDKIVWVNERFFRMTKEWVYIQYK